MATSHHLTVPGIGRVVHEHGKVDETWHCSRWDSITPVTPNWTAQLPGILYGRDRDGFMPRTEIVGYFERYAAVVVAPVRADNQVLRVEPTGEGGFRLHLLS